MALSSSILLFRSKPNDFLRLLRSIINFTLLVNSLPNSYLGCLHHLTGGVCEGLRCSLQSVLDVRVILLLSLSVNRVNQRWGGLGDRPCLSYLRSHNFNVKVNIIPPGLHYNDFILLANGVQIQDRYMGTWVIFDHRLSVFLRSTPTVCMSRLMYNFVFLDPLCVTFSDT